MGEKLVPLEEIFRDRNGLVGETKRRRSNLEYLQSVIRTRASLSLIELENLFEAIGRMQLSFGEVVILESLVRSRAAASERTQGWHAGFGDLLKHLTALRLAKEAA